MVWNVESYINGRDLPGFFGSGMVLCHMSVTLTFLFTILYSSVIPFIHSSLGKLAPAILEKERGGRVGEEEKNDAGRESRTTSVTWDPVGIQLTCLKEEQSQDGVKILNYNFQGRLRWLVPVI